MVNARPDTLTLGGWTIRRVLSFIAGLGMIVASVMTIRHFFMANYPKTIFAGSFCDISAFFNCDSSAFSSISQIMGIPLGFFGMFMGALTVLGTIFPSEAFERTNKSLSLANVAGVSLPSRRASRSWSTARIWSRTTDPIFPRKRHDTRNGYGYPPVVRGATMSVRR